MKSLRFLPSTLHSLKSTNIMNAFIQTVERQKAYSYFERFCAAYLMSHRNMQISFLHQMDEHARAKFLLPKRDVGIDMIGYTNEGTYAIQCKFQYVYDQMQGKGTAKRQQPQKQTLSWREFATFDSLCSRTGPWKGTILMTTAKSISFYGLKKRNEEFITHMDFQNMNTQEWMEALILAEEL